MTLRPLLCLVLSAALPAIAQVTSPPVRAVVDEDIRTLLRAAAAPADVDDASATPLPEPVRRYLRYTGADRGPAARLARVRFDGEVRLPQTGGAAGVERATPWMRTDGALYLVLSRDGLGYVWDTRWSGGPTAIDVRDLYLERRTHVWAVRDDGRTMVDERHPELGPTYMLRFFAEATQSPTMLRPGPHLRWEPVDDRRARAVMRDGPFEARMVCDFDAEGALTRCESDDRLLRFSGDVPRRWVPVRWVMTRGDYREIAGLRVPTTMSVGWAFPDGVWEQVRARVLELDFDVVRPLEHRP